MPSITKEPIKKPSTKSVNQPGKTQKLYPMRAGKIQNPPNNVLKTNNTSGVQTSRSKELKGWK